MRWRRLGGDLQDVRPALCQVVSGGADELRPLGGHRVPGDDGILEHVGRLGGAPVGDQRRGVRQRDRRPRPHRQRHIQRCVEAGVQIAVDQSDPPGLPIQRPRIAVRRFEDVDRLIAAGDPAEPGIGHRRLGGGDRDETGQRLAGVAGFVALDRSVERAALIGRGGHRNQRSPMRSGLRRPGRAARL